MSELRELDHDQCDRLLSMSHLGRLAYLEADNRPTIVPVNYAYKSESIAIRTNVGAKLANSPLSWVALEIDGADPNGEWGWSVTAAGHAFDISTALDDRSVDLRNQPVEPLAPGLRDHWLSIHVRERTGRVFGRPPIFEGLALSNAAEDY